MGDRIKEAISYYVNTLETVIPSDLNQSYGEECLGAAIYKKYETTLES